MPAKHNRSNTNITPLIKGLIRHNTLIKWVDTKPINRHYFPPLHTTIVFQIDKTIGSTSQKVLTSTNSEAAYKKKFNLAYFPRAL